MKTKIGWLSCLLALSALSAPSANALSEKDMLFYAPLDGTLDAVVAKGSAIPKVKPAQPQFVEGHRGQGLLTGGPANSDLAYATAGNMDLAAGSVAMWVKSVDWGNDGYLRFFFRVGETADAGKDAGRGNFLWLYKGALYSTWWTVQHDTPQQAEYFVAPRATDRGGEVAFDFHKGQWSHFIGAWSGNQISLYINGQYVGSTYTPTPRLLRTLADRFYIGGLNNQGNGGNETADTVIDEVMILRRPVTPAEAELLYRKGHEAFDANETAPAKPLFKVAPGYLPSHDEISATFSVVGRRPDELQGLTIRYQIKSSEDGKTVQEGRIPLGQVQQTQRLEGRALPQGTYQFQATLLEQNAVVAESGSSFEKLPRAEWLGNQLGITDAVPAPWTPIECSGSAAGCWGRAYEWDQNVFPAQITTAGQTLLARPITLVAVVDGKRCVLDPGIIRWKSTTPARAEFAAKAEIGGLPVEVTGWLEYDGFVWSRIAISPRQGATLSALTLEIPLRSEAATLMQGRPPVPEPGQVRNFNGALRFSPFIWVGNERGGLQWCTEDTRDWKLKSDEEMVRLTVGEKETVLRLTLVDQAISFDHPLQYSMGLEATPVKPMNEDRRAWEAGLGKYPGAKGWEVSEQWNRIGQALGGPYGYQVASEHTSEFLKSLQRDKQALWIYWHQHAIWPGDPVLRAYGAEWGGAYQAAADPLSAIVADHAKASVRDYLVWMNWKLLKDNPELAKVLAGIYIDVAQAVWTPEQADGAPYNLYTVLGTRELQQRLFVMWKKNWPRVLICNHQSGDVHMSQLAFSDMMLTGEHLTGDPRLMQDLGYYHVLTLERMRAEYIGSNFGIPMLFLPEIERSFYGDAARAKKIYGPEGIPASEHLLGMLWVHDVIEWPAYVHPAPFEQAGRAKLAFGWDRETKFHGYWEDPQWVKTTASQSPVVTSVFTRKGKALFVVTNNSDADAQVELTPDWNALGVSAPAMLADAYAEQAVPAVQTTIPLAGGRARLTVKARNFRALVAQ